MALDFQAAPPGGVPLPVLCSQSSNQDNVYSAAPGATNQISLAAGDNTYIGYRNQKSFRYLGIPYANQPARFTYSTLYTPQGQTINATEYASECAQSGAGSENSLFLNIQTPYIPEAGSTTNLRPVIFWIHGGGFTGGTGADPGSDGGNLASREDIAVVTINYRLSTLGFLAIPSTSITGKYGIAHQITVLQWTIDNVANLGGDPNMITIIGESAGAGSAQAGQQIFQEAGCTRSTLQSQIACLEQVPALTLVGLSTVARYVVQDGHFVNTEELDVVNRYGNTANVHIIFGNVINDGVTSGAFKTSYYYQMQRPAGGYDPNGLGGPPIEPGYPYGDPQLPYFRLHGSDVPWVFGNLYPLRDSLDLYSIQLESGYFAEFVKSGQPNPPLSYLQVRQYDISIKGIAASGSWNPVTNAQGQMKLLDFPSSLSDFQDLPQCAFLKYSINYYLAGGM
ncbi:hypothetical protein MMC15_001620 [Xylographa vitiligo]|nr:hypothetical protein [Xylographa vitiligo]